MFCFILGWVEKRNSMWSSRERSVGKNLTKELSKLKGQSKKGELAGKKAQYQLLNQTSKISPKHFNLNIIIIT